MTNILTHKEIMEQMKNEAFESIIKMKDGNLKKYSTPFITINDALDIFDSLNIDYLDDLETNGWEMDFWFSGRYEDSIISVSGSAYYGGMNFIIEKEG